MSARTCEKAKIRVGLFVDFKGSRALLTLPSSQRMNAKDIASFIDLNPLAAAEIKHFIPGGERRLIECLDLKTPANDVAEALAEQAVLQDPDPLAELARSQSKGGQL